MDNLTLFKVTLFYFDIWLQLQPGQTNDSEGTLTDCRKVHTGLLTTGDTRQYDNNNQQAGLDLGCGVRDGLGGGGDDVLILRVALPPCLPASLSCVFPVCTVLAVLPAR